MSTFTCMSNNLKTETIGQKILHFPLTKIIIGIIVVVGIVAAGQFGFESLMISSPLGDPILQHLLSGMITAVLALVSYQMLYHYLEKRQISELSPKKVSKTLLIGILLGSVLQSLTILVIYLKGGFSVVSVNPVLAVVPALIMAFTSAIFEEVLVRGIVFRILEEKLGSYLALAISALIFGALHLGNPNSTWLAALGLALQAGCFLAAAYIYSRSLWFPIAIHFAWNFTQAGIFGATVSGNAIGDSLLTTKIEGAEWYTGGAFGPEGSLQATLLCLIPTVILLVLSQKQNKIVKPYWQKIPLQ